MPHPDDPPVPPPPPLPVVPELNTTLDSPGLLDPLKRKFGESRRMGDENKVSLLSLSFIPCHPTNKLTHFVDSALAQESLFRRRPLTSTLNYPITYFSSLSSDVQLRAQCKIADFQSRRDELQKAVDDYIEKLLGSDCWPLQTMERKRRGSRATRQGMKR